MDVFEPDKPLFMYNSMEPSNFENALDIVGVTAREFSVLFGLRPKLVERWLSGEIPIPLWVPIVCALMSQLDGRRLADQVMNAYKIGKRSEIKMAEKFAAKEDRS